MKNISLFLLAITVLFTPIVARAQTLDDANRAFAAGHFADSTAAYQALIAQHGYSAPVLFDLGNSYYSAGDYARAILAYKRAQVLAPSDADIAANLELAQKKAGLAVAEPRLREKIVRVLSPSGWAWLGCTAWTLLCASLLARTVLWQKRSLFALTAAASALVLGAALIGASISSSVLQKAVVTDKNATALISPFPAAQAVFSPAPGDTLAVHEAHDDYLFVSDSAGHSGWVSKTQLMPVIAQ